MLHLPQLLRGENLRLGLEGVEGEGGWLPLIWDFFDLYILICSLRLFKICHTPPFVPADCTSELVNSHGYVPITNDFRLCQDPWVLGDLVFVQCMVHAADCYSSCIANRKQ